jgi:hypothetical protein
VNCIEIQADTIKTTSDSGLTVNYATNSGRLKTEHKYEKAGDLYKFGQGSSDLEMQSTSEDLMIE